MEDSVLSKLAPLGKQLAPYVVAVVVGGAGLGYAVHEHHDAEDLAVQNAQVTAQLNETHSQLDALEAKVNELAANSQASTASPTAPPDPEVTPQPAPAAAPQSVPAATKAAKPRGGTHRAAVQDPRFNKLQSQVDAQSKQLEDTRTDLASARTELTGSIARTHGELVVLQRRGERNYYEFDLQKSKEFKRQGPISLSLRKANTKHQYADLQLTVDDRNLSQKHVNLYQPVMFYQPDTAQPVEVVINEISKDHIHGYVSAPKYKQSELTASAGSAGYPGQGPEQAAAATSQLPTRQKLPMPTSESNNP
jgi:uncharacterized coiled-coil protein SlyX